jgi:glycosyltransferase involved in cell wall biosynthesis
MKKVVHIVDYLCMGGRENVVIDICNNLNKDKYKAYVISLSNDNNEIADRLDPDVTFIALPIGLKTRKNRIVFLLSFFSIRKKLIQIIKCINPEIVHTHSYVHRLLVIASALHVFSKKISFFHTVHTSGMYFEKSGIINFIKLSIEKFALTLYKPSLIAISEIVQENNIRFYKKYTKKTSYIPNGINVDIFNRKKYNIQRSVYSANDNDIIISYVSRISEGKNHLTLLKSMILLTSKKENIKLYLAGDGELRNELEQFVVNNGLQNNVVFLGSINNVPELLSITDIGVFPSEFEGFGLSLFEMMAMELPVVVADNEIFKKFISHEVNGLIFPMHNHVSLFDNVLRLIEDDKLAALLKHNGRKFSEQFSIKKMISSYEIYYES